jgi:microcystin-dependent protein
MATQSIDNPAPIVITPIFIPENWSVITTNGTTTTSAVSTKIVGEIISYTGVSVPSSNWLFCDGSSYPASAYNELYSVIGTTYGGSGGNFNVPDLRSKIVVGSDSNSILTTTYGGSSVTTGGNKTMSENQLTSHNHSIVGLPTGMLQTLNQNNAIQGIGAGTVDIVKSGVGNYVTYTATAGNAGNSADLLPPFSVCNFLIRAN